MQALREAGRDREAWLIAQALSVRHSHDVALAAITGAIAARMGDSASARRIEARLASWSAPPDSHWIRLAQARLSAALGDRDRAVALLHAACDHGCGYFEDIHSDLEFDALRSYPPFREFLRPRR